MDVEFTRKQEIVDNLRKVISSVYEIDKEDVDTHATFLEMGLDSISIIQVKQLVRNEYQLDVMVNRLFDDLSTLDKLADHIDATLPAADPKIVSAPGERKTPIVNIPVDLPAVNEMQGSTADLQNIIQYQLQIMSRQIEIMARLNADK